MGNRMITIGRSSRSVVRIDERWDTVSNQHADIEEQGDNLVFFDHSSNGTVINGQKIQNCSVKIYPGDEILLAGVFMLEWNVINQFFPDHHRPTVTRNIRGVDEQSSSPGRTTVQFNDRTSEINNGFSRQENSRLTEQFNRDSDGNRSQSQTVREQNKQYDNHESSYEYSQAEIDKALDNWNWGAFFCSWLWGIIHKVYWPLLMLIVGFIPYAGIMFNFFISVYLGLKGSRLAWESGRYKDFEDYKRNQLRWAIGGLIWFLLNVFAYGYITYEILSVL